VVDLPNLTYDRVPVGNNPTDLDISPDGENVAVVTRGSNEVWVLSASHPFELPQVVTLDKAYGSVLFAGDGAKAILYTNASRIASYAVWDTLAGTVTDRSLVKPVQSMGVSPTGGSLLVFHTQEDAPDADEDSPFYGNYALTLIDLGDYRQNPMLLPAAVSSYAVSDDGSFGFFTMEGQRYLETLTFDTLLYDEVRLASDPVYLGVLPDTDIAWASQDHELGRISFYDAAAGTLDTITGFELNSDIDH
jgi:DNA-binding beta-propeller fold protein YncE